MNKFYLGSLFLGTALLTGCATAPVGPSVLVMPGTGKSFDEFSRDEAYCRTYALNQVGGKTPGKAGQDSAVASGIAGTAIGAAAGAAFGGRQGAAVGAGTGLLIGSMSGSSTGYQERHQGQAMYDNAYIQCMYGAGHKVPVPQGMFMDSKPVTGSPSPLPPSPPPPPPR